MRLILSSLLLLSSASFAHAQERTIARAGLPRAVEERLTQVIENPATRQITGEATITEAHEGDVVVFNGPLTLSGSIKGELIVVDGDVDFQEGSSVTGDVTLVGGDANGLENAVIGGTVTMYGEGFSLFKGRDRVLTVNSRTRRVYTEDYHSRYGHSDFELRTGWNYNRVEGLPVHFGPVIETAGRNPARFEAMAIWRTEVSSPWDTEELGYSVRAEQFLGGRRDFRIGASLQSVIDPIESWQMSKSEASLAAFVLHDDYRDYFKREGWSAYARYAPRGTGFTANVEYRDEDHSSEPARDPWTLFDNSDRWRLQPLVGEGSLRSVTGSFEIDRRNDDDFASSGFLLRADVTNAIGSRLAGYDDKFTSGLLDARVYQRAGVNATLSFRLLAAGTITDNALPPQFQHALGGAASLPGYATFSADCGARDFTVVRGENTFFQSYGCDRTALFSAEYRGGFDLRWGGLDAWDEDDDWDWDMSASPNWILFFDAARGWAHADSKARGARDTGTLYDIGAGLLLGDLGIYAAVPLTGEDRSMRFFVRVGPRF